MAPHPALPMNLRYFPHRFRAIADWVSCPSAVALKLWGSPRSGVQCAKICLGEFSPHAIGTERGCVEDQPQRVGSSKASGACRVLRLVEDDTAALRLPDS